MRDGSNQPPPRAIVFGDGRGLQIDRDGGDPALISALWLRQACGCAKCRTSPLGQRTYELPELLARLGDGADLRVIVDDVTADGVHASFVGVGEAHVGFVPFESIGAAIAPSEHRSSWPEHGSWLIDHAVSAADPDMAVHVADDVMRYGLALVRNVRCEPGEVLVIANRLGFVRDTNYGAVFDVRSEPDPQNLAYSSAGLSAHTDNPYRDPCPTVQLLHCIRQAGNGGRSIFVDGFDVAARVQSNRPEDYHVLSSTDVAFQYRDDDVDLRATAPVLATDATRSVTQVRYNNRSMVGPVGLEASRVTAFFDAYRRFAGDVAEAERSVRLRLEPGDLVVFDNRRVLHGREAFEVPATGGDRWLQGCYIDLDAVASLARRG